jgi:hypothetical protein
MASGDTLIIFTAHANEPPALNYATVDLRSGHLVLDFDAAVSEHAIFAGVLPRHYSGGGITATIVWTAGATTLRVASGLPTKPGGIITPFATGNVKWNGAFERHQAGIDDLDADSFATTQTATSAAPATDGTTQYTNIIFTDGAQIDSIAIGEAFRFKLSRDAANVADTMAIDAELLVIELRET